jgi:isopenicillin-N epimerase
VSDQEYFSSANALEVIAKDLGVQVIRVELPYPVTSEDSVLDCFSRAITPSVRYAMVDHIVSSTGMVLPLKKIIDLLKASSIETVVDGAHGPGQLPLNLHELGCLAYTGNCHKWLCSPRSAALLYVRPDFQAFFRPLVLSHLPSELETSLSDYQLYFRWNGTPDPTPELSVPFAVDFMSNLVPGGWNEVMELNRTKALSARDILCGTLGVEAPCPESMVGSMAAIPIGKGIISGKKPLHWTEPMQNRLKEDYGIIVPITEIRGGSHRLLRISAQLYNSAGQYSYLADSLRKILTG